MFDKTFTVNDIRALRPCYDPLTVDGCSETWTGTAQDILRADHISAVDRLWVVLRLVPRSVVLEFAWWAALRVQHLMRDERSTRALDVLRAYLDGTATLSELFVTIDDAAAAYAAAAYAADAATNAAVTATAVAYAAAAAYAADAAAYAAAAAADADDAAAAERETQVERLLTLLNEYSEPATEVTL